MKLKDQSLFRQQAYIDGAWADADSKATFPVRDPADNSPLGTVPDMGAAETKRAIKAAEAAFPAWSRRPAKERTQILRKWFDLMMANVDDLAVLMTAEQGKPMSESRGEVAYGASFVEYYAEEARRIYGDSIPTPSNDRRIMVVKQPIGVVAAITPWNFPNAMITRKCAPALAAGCTVIVKPAEDTPYSALALAELATRAGIPKGVFNIVTTNSPAAVGGEMTANPTVRKLSFTGSTEIGRLLMKQSAQTVKKVALELGGNAPFIVFDDADLDEAVKGAIASKFRNAGQTCVCANRIYAQDKIYDDFVGRFAQAASALRVGHGLKGETDQGPLINPDALAKVERLVDDAKAKGARIVLGGKRHALGGTFFEPTVIANVNRDMAFSREEIFGPVAPVYRFKTDDEVVKAANDTEFGLAAYFYSRDIGRVTRVSEQLEYGIVSVNTGIFSTEVAPFGGWKESGIGREGSHHGIEEFMELKYICLGGVDR